MLKNNINVIFSKNTPFFGKYLPGGGEFGKNFGPGVLNPPSLPGEGRGGKVNLAPPDLKIYAPLPIYCRLL